uniref:Uncharacterized protein n=1 Tax=Lotus japonicus TaxID=34305 RepID=I3S9I5_LOTJA|nr:unknown [Lotus japonicus]
MSKHTILFTFWGESTNHPNTHVIPFWAPSKENKQLCQPQVHI